MDERILVVDDDALLTDSLAFILRQEGYQPSVVVNGAGAVEATLSDPPDLVLLDLSLPDLNGVEVCRRIRELSRVPILMLTARRQEIDKIRGLDAGADDYVTKPFTEGELLARVRAQLRRAAGPVADGSDQALTIGELRIDPAAREVWLGKSEVQLSAREFDLLRLLAVNARRVVPRKRLFDTVWGAEFVGDERALDVYIRTLRRKIEPNPEQPSYILTARGVGYKLVSPRDDADRDD
ncbi:MAG: response regulator transcription factor [Chloroflexota bacterium]